MHRHKVHMSTEEVVSFRGITSPSKLRANDTSSFKSFLIRRYRSRSTHASFLIAMVCSILIFLSIIQFFSIDPIGEVQTDVRHHMRRVNKDMKNVEQIHADRKVQEIKVEKQQVSIEKNTVKNIGQVQEKSSVKVDSVGTSLAKDKNEKVQKIYSETKNEKIESANNEIEKKESEVNSAKKQGVGKEDDEEIFLEKDLSANSKVSVEKQKDELGKSEESTTAKIKGPLIKTNYEDEEWEVDCKFALGEGQSLETSQSFARIVLFQQNGGHQLQNFVTYHSKVLPVRDIVIIDHHTDVSDDYTDISDTQNLLRQYKKLGADVWKCKGSFEYKAEMWSHVANQYARKSDYIFPLDIDEFITIVKDNAQKNETLAWNERDFHEALDKLPKDTGLPFKFERGTIQPIDCPMTLSEKKMKQTQESPLSFQNTGIEAVRYFQRRQKRDTQCWDKAFFRGHEFNATDTGNHVGQTHTWTKDELVDYCEGHNYYLQEEVKSSLVLMHFQAIDFNEWLLHKLRGASDRRFNKFTKLKDCEEVIISKQYCEIWEKIHKTKFDPRKLKDLYIYEACPDEKYDETYPIDIQHLLRVAMR
ncbi:predicted protein [Chaetoceros tenuissimus]|uniref:Glycosyltransferase family 92 protein n=1 Tax=Chaetoceros tenuissimus TaxID=426638 RepID=A0AAD3H194_9STRA|nr:predicted protein [Chaetoceros tenuissimus]